MADRLITAGYSSAFSAR